MLKKFKFFSIIILIFPMIYLSYNIFGTSKINSYPIDADLSLEISNNAGVFLELGPLGEITYPSKRGLLKLEIAPNSITPNQLSEFLKKTDYLSNYNINLKSKIEDSFKILIIKVLAFSSILSFILGLLFFRKIKYSFLALIINLFLNSLILSYSYYNFDKDKFYKPKFTGLMAITPSLVGEASDIYQNFDVYKKQLVRLVDNTTNLFLLAKQESTELNNSTKILHVSDLHLNPIAFDLIKKVKDEFKIDIIIDTGDISDHGSKFEEYYYKEISKLIIPYIYVRGNHDSSDTERALVKNKNLINLSSGLSVIINDILFAGVGDYRFTPDKSNNNIPPVIDYKQLFNYKGADFFITHDPLLGSDLDGIAKYILSGDTHKREIKKLKESYLLTQGSTGGGGLRPYSKDGKLNDLELSILYFDNKSKKVSAVDEISVSGYGRYDIRLDRVYLK
jgi:predicted phosphodiesterase